MVVAFQIFIKKLNKLKIMQLFFPKSAFDLDPSPTYVLNVGDV